MIEDIIRPICFLCQDRFLVILHFSVITKNKFVFLCNIEINQPACKFSRKSTCKITFHVYNRNQVHEFMKFMRYVSRQKGGNLNEAEFCSHNEGCGTGGWSGPRDSIKGI